MVESGDSGCQRSNGGYQYCCVHFAGKQTKKTFAYGTVNLENLEDSREPTGAPVLWLSCEGELDVCDLFSNNSHLSAVLDRQELLVAAPVDLRTK